MKLRIRSMKTRPEANRFVYGLFSPDGELLRAGAWQEVYLVFEAIRCVNAVFGYRHIAS